MTKDNPKDIVGASPKEMYNMKKEIPKIKSEIENIYINIIQIVAIVVAVLALILGNVLGYSVRPENISPNNLIGYLFIINAITLTGITFLIFMIKFLFLKSKWNCYYSIFLIPIVIFYLIGFALIL